MSAKQVGWWVGLAVALLVAETVFMFWSDQQMDQAVARLDDTQPERARVARSQISQVLRRSEIVEVALTVIAIVVALAAISVAVRVTRRHNRFLELKALELERFAGTVAHDLLGPLSAVGLAMPLIQQRHRDDEQTQRLAERSISSVRRVSQLVDGILQFARSGAQPTSGPCDVEVVLRDAAAGVQAEAEKASIELVVESQPGLAACAPGVLLSILSNLLQNSIKYMGDAPERRLVVRAFPRGDRLAFEVEDTGPGVPDELRETIFEPYFRLPGTPQPGLGLGLATVERLVKAHGGSLGVHAAESGGARFWFQLPSA